MSILIKGMEMPKHGMVINIYADGRVSNHFDEFCETIATAVPVPPHGRLIGKSALLDKCYQHYEDFMLGKVDGKTALLNIEKEIKAAPTIIPAEEGE